jgi:hypothetical protein
LVLSDCETAGLKPEVEKVTPIGAYRTLSDDDSHLSDESESTRGGRGHHMRSSSGSDESHDRYQDLPDSSASQDQQPQIVQSQHEDIISINPKEEQMEVADTSGILVKPFIASFII